MWGAELRLQDSGFRDSDFGIRIRISGIKIRDPEFGIQVLRIRVQGLGFRV